jgi:hypothetical protein
MVVFSACQKEENVLIDETDPETITANSTVTQYLIRASENAGDFDDIIDGFSCGSIVLPITVIANGQEVVINSEEDYAVVAAIFGQFPNDNDTLEIVFPITIRLEDFTEVTVNSQADLDAIIALCEGDLDDAIECVDFVYPITFFVYNSNQQQTDTVTVNTNFELYQFLSNLDSDDYISVDFPVSVIVNGEITEVTNNAELLDIISNANCDEDPVNTDLVDTLTSGSWYITYYFDEYDETGNFSGYAFTFNTDNTAQASNGSNVVPGTWGVNSDLTYVDMDFGNTVPFNELYASWDIIEISSEEIRFKDVSGGNGSTDYLTFGRTPNDGSNNEVNAFIEQLTTGVWYVNLFDDDGINDTCDYDGYAFNFNTSGMVSATGTTETKHGFWAVEVDSGGDLELILNFEYDTSDDPFEELNDDWDVLNFDVNFINLKDTSGSGTNYLNFGREPSPDCGGGGGDTPDPQELIDIMVSGTWYVDTFLDDGNNETSDFNGYDFNFYANQTVIATNGSENVYGIWIITLISEELNFEFDMDSPINGADDAEYKVLQFTNTSVTLITKDSNGNIEDTLIFKKN